MTTPLEFGSRLPVELRIKNNPSTPQQPQWARLRLLGEDEIVDLLQERLGKSEAEVRQVLESYHRPAACA